jgi:hypothetical protein
MEVWLMVEIEVIPQKIVDIKTIILKSRLDSAAVKLQGEKYKRNFFAKFFFIKPKADDVPLIFFEKYYEPYVVLGGKYSIDYCKKHNYIHNVGEQTSEVFVGGKAFTAEALNLNQVSTKVINLEGEEYVHHQKETYFVLDRLRREIKVEKLQFAPSDESIEKLANEFNFRKVDTSLEADIDFVRSKIAQRPLDVNQIMRETLDISERYIIYCPVYELVYENIPTRKKVTLFINGVSGEMVLLMFDKRELNRLHDISNEHYFSGDFLVPNRLESTID